MRWLTPAIDHRGKRTSSKSARVLRYEFCWLGQRDAERGSHDRWQCERVMGGLLVVSHDAWLPRHDDARHGCDVPMLYGAPGKQASSRFL